MSRKRVPVVQHVKDGLVTEVLVPYNPPYAIFERLEVDKGNGLLRVDRSRLHLHPLDHHALMEEVEVKRTRFTMTGHPDGTGYSVGDPRSSLRDGSRLLPWRHQAGYVLIVRKADGQTRLIPGRYEYLREIGQEIQKGLGTKDRAHSIVQIGILVCNDPDLPRIHGLDENHIPMPGYKDDWDVILRQDIRYTPHPTH